MKRILHRVLSFDGGGIRGLYQAKLLERLKAYGLDVAARADVIAGTSTGAIVAAALAIGKEPQAISRLYSDVGEKVFPQRGWISHAYDWVSHEPSYSSDLLRKTLEEQLGRDTKLGDCAARHKRLIIPAISLTRYQPKVFDSDDDADKECRLVDVVLASAAAPTYFLPAKVGDTYYVDGGLCCNNPGFRAVARLFREGAELSRIYLLSVSTGGVPVTQDGSEYTTFSAFGWIRPIIDIAMSGSSDLAVQDSNLVGYHCRVTEDFSRQIGLDDYANAVKFLPSLAEGKAAEVRYLVKRWFDGPERTGQNFAGRWKSTYKWEGADTTDTLQVDQLGNYIVGETVGTPPWRYEFSGMVDGAVCMGKWKGEQQGTFLVVMSTENHTVKGQWIGTGDAKPYFGEWSWEREQ